MPQVLQNYLMSILVFKTPEPGHKKNIFKLYFDFIKEIKSAVLTQLIANTIDFTQFYCNVNPYSQLPLTLSVSGP